MALHIVLSNRSGVPIYEQVTEGIRTAILRGDLAEGVALPSIRALARDLQISVITTTRAYADLATQGYITNVPGKGSYVLARDSELMREHVLSQIEVALEQAVRIARIAGIDGAELHTLLKQACEQVQA